MGKRREIVATRRMMPLAGCTLLLLAGCASAPVTVVPVPPAKFQVLGHGSGRACGTMGFAFMQFFPVGLNERVGNAYQQALNSVPGATVLTNVELSEDWFWWFLATTRCTTIKGEGVREVKG